MSTHPETGRDESESERIDRQQDKEHIVRTGNRIIILGLGLLAVAMTGAVVFITDVLYKHTTAYLVRCSASARSAPPVSTGWPIWISSG